MDKKLMKLTKNQRQEIIKKLLANEVLILPTDTIYGLSLLVENNNPQVLNKLKKAPLDKPLIILVDRFKTIKKQIIFNQESKKILKAKVPTTVIFKAVDSEKTLAIRLCKRKDLKKILRKTGPIYSTSVNLSKQVPITSEAELKAFLKQPENVY
jgi:L-threonylcarbamoyladenylate synthase